jgi:hypothetical protein
MKTLRRVPLLIWIFGAIAATALIAWPLGGWDTVKVVSKELPSYAEGQTFHGHRFDVAIGEVRLSAQDPRGADPKAGEIFLIADVDVTNVWHEPTEAGTLTFDNLKLENEKFDGKLGPSVVLADDATYNPELNMGLKRSIQIVWTISDSALKTGDTVRFQLYDSVPRAGFVVHGTSWADLFEAATAERTIS